MRKRFASSMAITSKFQQLAEVSKSIVMEWSLCRQAMISSALKNCGREQFSMAECSEKRTSWWNQDVIEAMRAKKDAH